MIEVTNISHQVTDASKGKVVKRNITIVGRRLTPGAVTSFDTLPAEITALIYNEATNPFGMLKAVEVNPVSSKPASVGVAEEVAPEAEVVEEVTPEPESEVVEEVTPEPESEVVEEVTPEPEAEVAEEVTPEPEVEVVEEATPETEVAPTTSKSTGRRRNKK